MAWFWQKVKIPELPILEKEIIESPAEFSNSLCKKLKLLDFACSWELSKIILPQVDKTKARSLVRSLFADNNKNVTEQLENKEEINHAISCLEYLPSRDTVEALVKLLAHIDDTIQLIVASTLKNHTPRLVVPCLIEKLLAGEVQPARAGEVLLEMGYLAQESLLEAYEKAKPQVKAQILELLTLSHYPKCQPLLMAALKDEEPALKKAALQAVSEFMCRDLWPEVALCLNDPAWPLRVKALEVITKLRVIEALENVQACLEDADPWVRKEAAACLEVLEKA